jgi:hypothetical protein
MTSRATSGWPASWKLLEGGFESFTHRRNRLRLERSRLHE